MRVLYVVFLTALFLVGCKTTEPTYYYGAYSETVYSYFKADDTSISQQVSALEEIVERARGKNKPVAPGIHAHLGMLYFESGNADQGTLNFELEKTLFPESANYLNFLMNNMTGAKI